MTSLENREDIQHLRKAGDGIIIYEALAMRIYDMRWPNQYRQCSEAARFSTCTTH